jgi:hypothetical protein
LSLKEGKANLGEKEHTPSLADYISMSPLKPKEANLYKCRVLNAAFSCGGESS